MQIKWEKKIHRICTAAVALLIFATVAGAIWNLSLYLFNSDVLDEFGNQMASSGVRDLAVWLFKDNALTTGFISLCVFVFVLLTAVTVLMSIRNGCSQKVLPERRGALQIIRIFAGFALLAIPVIYAVFYVYGFDLGKFRGTMNLAAMLLALPASLYFLFPGITDRFTEFLQTLFGICFIGFAIFSLVVTHSYMYEGLTSPVRTCNLLSLVSMMLFILYEVRFLAAKPLPNLYVFSAGAALFFCGINCLPRLILTLLGEMPVSVQTIYGFLELTIALYAACRLLLFLSEWRYTIRINAEAETLPETVTLADNATENDTVEPDYTEDSEIESPILEADIDLELFDRAFDGTTPTKEDALDSLAQPDAFSEAGESIDPLEAILKDAPTDTEIKNKTISVEEQTDDNRFDMLSDELFGNKEDT